jgi:hypothetical protein
MHTHFRDCLFGPVLRAASAVAFVAACAAFPAVAAPIQVTANPDLLIPDGNDSGTFSIINIPTSTQSITDISLTLNLVGGQDGAWNGDFYIYLAHDGYLSVLANRPGVTGNNSFGYGDNGLAQVTFDDDALLGDFHVYQATLNTTDTTLPITGTFQPDGRATDPSIVALNDPRTALLSGFHGQNPEGEWRLFLADLSPGGTARLASWELNLITEDVVQVPESGPGLALYRAVGVAHRPDSALPPPSGVPPTLSGTIQLKSMVFTPRRNAKKCDPYVDSEHLRQPSTLGS